jgi:hypothetical protein
MKAPNGFSLGVGMRAAEVEEALDLLLLGIALLGTTGGGCEEGLGCRAASMTESSRLAMLGSCVYPVIISVITMFRPSSST